MLRQQFVLPQRHRGAGPAAGPGAGPGARQGEEAEGRFVGSALTVSLPAVPGPVVAREEEFTQQTGPLLRSLTNPALSDLHGRELPLHQEVNVGQVGGVVVLRQLAGQGLQVGRALCGGEGYEAGDSGEPDKHVLLANISLVRCQVGTGKQRKYLGKEIPQGAAGLFAFDICVLKLFSLPLQASIKNSLGLPTRS